MVCLLAEWYDTKSNVKLWGFRFQLQASYVSSHTKELWYNETVCLWMTIYIYIYIYEISVKLVHKMKCQYKIYMTVKMYEKQMEREKKTQQKSGQKTFVKNIKCNILRISMNSYLNYNILCKVYDSFFPIANDYFYWGHWHFLLTGIKEFIF